MEAPGVGTNSRTPATAAGKSSGELTMTTPVDGIASASIVTASSVPLSVMPSPWANDLNTGCVSVVSVNIG